MVSLLAPVEDVVLLVFVCNGFGDTLRKLPENLGSPCSIRVIRFIQHVEDALSDEFTGRQEFALIGY
jgi:hypothetical protein